MRPVVVLSHCLADRACRYDGSAVRDAFVAALAPHVEIVPVCPEVEIGLGIPRDPVVIVEQEGRQQLVQPSTRRELTGAMQEFSEKFLGSLESVDGFILKSRSPSCGIRDTKVLGREGDENPVRLGPGRFGGEVLKRFPAAAAEDERRLADADLRDRFLTRLFTNARFREAKRGGTVAALGRFHAEHRLLLLAYREDAMRRLGRIAANEDRKPAGKVFKEYASALGAALSKPATRSGRVKAYEHGLKQVSRHLSAEEKRQFADLLKRYQKGTARRALLEGVLERWGGRFRVPTLEGQVIFRPYPEELKEMQN